MSAVNKIIAELADKQRKICSWQWYLGFSFFPFISIACWILIKILSQPHNDFGKAIAIKVIILQIIIIAIISAGYLVIRLLNKRVKSLQNKKTEWLKSERQIDDLLESISQFDPGNINSGDEVEVNKYLDMLLAGKTN